MAAGASYPSIPGDTDLAAIASLLADPARARVLLALSDGRSLAASVLAEEAGVSASTASYHLSHLTDAGLVRCSPRGRYRYYTLAGSHVSDLIEAVARLAPQLPVTSLRQGTRAGAMRQARSCYDHLAGRLGVALLDALVARGTLSGPDGEVPGIFTVTGAGARYLYGIGVGARAQERSRGCLDWTEQRPHLAGALGRQLLERFFALGWVVRHPGARALRVTEIGCTELSARFGVALTP